MENLPAIPATITLLGREYAMPNPTYDLKPFDQSRIEVLLTGSAIKPEKIMVFIDPNSDTMQKYMNDFYDDADTYSGIAVCLSEASKIPYGVLMPIQFDGSDLPACNLDKLAKCRADMHPAIRRARDIALAQARKEWASQPPPSAQ